MSTPLLSYSKDELNHFKDSLNQLDFNSNYECFNRFQLSI